MAGTKISALGSLSVLADGSIIPVVDSGTNYKLAATVIRDYVLSGLVTATNFAATSNGLGTSFKIGDDAWIGDVNVANGFRVTGVEDGTKGYIIFGNANNTSYIGRDGTNPITVTGNFAVTGTTTLATSLTGLLKSASGVVSTATAGSDYVAPSALSSYAPINSPTFTGTVTIPAGASISGYATTASVPTTVTINGTSVTLGSSGTVTAAAGTLTGNTLASGVTASSLTSVGTLSTLTVSGALSIKDVRDTVYPITSGSGTSSGTITPDAANGNIQTVTLTGSITLNAFANPVSGQSITMIITQPSSGGPYTLTSSMKFANGAKTLSTAANAIDMLTVSYIGTTYYASLITGFA